MKRILTILIVLFSLSAGAQTLPGYFTPVASPYAYDWIRAVKYFRLPQDTLSTADAGSMAWKSSKLWVRKTWWEEYTGGGAYVAGYGLILSSNTFRADTFALATRDKAKQMIDSAKATVPVPTLQQVLTAGNTATLSATTTGTLTGATVQTTDGQAYLSNPLGFGTAGFRDADGIVQTQITGFTDSSSNGRGKVNTSVFTFKPMTNRLPNGASTSGYANLYYRAGAFRVSVDGVETDLGSGGGLSSVGYGLVLSGGVPRADTFALATRDKAKQMIDSAYNVAVAPRLYDSYNQSDTLTESRGVWMQTYGVTFYSEDGTEANATGINNSGFTTKRSKHDFTANNGWIYGQLHDPAQVYKSRFQVIGLVNDSTHSAQLISANGNTYNRKAALVSAAWWEGVKLQANVNWKTSGASSGYKGLYITGGDGLGAGTLSIDGEVLGVGSGSDSALVRKSDGTIGLYPLGGGSTYTPTITTSSATTLTLGTSYETYVFTGSSATTWTLPAISGDTGRRYFVKNRGTANITLQRAGSDQLYNTSLVTSITILPGGSFMVQNDGTYWVVLF